MPTVRKVAAPVKRVARKKPEPAKPVSKVVSIIVSVGDEDRDRPMDDFIDSIKAALKGGKVKANGVAGTTLAQHYYIVNGKVCDPKDFDPKTLDFKPGAAPPSWAGGPDPARINRDSTYAKGLRDPVGLTTLDEAKRDLAKKPRTPQEALRELRSNPPANSDMYGTKKSSHPRRTTSQFGSDTNSDVGFDWEEDDATDDAALSAEVTKQRTAAVRRVVKKATPAKPTRRVVRKK